VPDPCYDKLQRIRILITLKRYAEAIRIIDAILTEKEDQVLFYYKMSLLYQSGRFDELRKTADYAVSRFPESLSMRIWHLISDIKIGDVLAAADLMPSIDRIASSDKKDDRVRFPDSLAERFYGSVRFLKEMYGKSVMTWEMSDLIRKMADDRVPQEIIEGLYTSHFDHLDRNLKDLNGNSRSFYLLSKGRIGDALLDMLRNGQAEIYRKFMLDKFTEFYKQTESQRDPFIMAVHYHIARLKDRSIRALNDATSIDYMEKGIARMIIESENNVLTSSEIPQTVQALR